MIGKILRIVNWAGPCINHGRVIGETAKFWVIEPMGFEHRVTKCEYSSNASGATRSQSNSERTTYG